MMSFIKLLKTLDFSKHAPRVMKRCITLENILKHTIIKYITYTGRYEQAI